MRVSTSAELRPEYLAIFTGVQFGQEPAAILERLTTWKKGWIRKELGTTASSLRISLPLFLLWQKRTMEHLSPCPAHMLEFGLSKSDYNKYEKYYISLIHNRKKYIS